MTSNINPNTITSEELNKLVEKMHAEKYPDGCRSTFATMCEACCARLGAAGTMKP